MIFYIICFIASVALYYFVINKDNRKYPPGPRGYPLVGSAFSLSKQSYVQFTKWAQEYGDIMQFKVFGSNILILSDPKTVKEVFNRDATTGRMPDGYVVSVHGDGIDRGIVKSSGETWEQLRRFTLRQLRDFGFGKSSMESMIMEEVNEIIRWMKSQEGIPVGEIKEKMSLAVVSSLWNIVSSEKLDHDDAGLKTLASGITKISADLAETGGLIILAPWLRHVAPELSGYNTVRKVFDGMREYAERAIGEHKRSHSTDFSRDFIDVFLTEKKKKSNDPSSAFYGEEGEKQLTSVVVDLFLAGSDTSSATLDFTFLYLASFPEVQKKLQKEIDEVTGGSRSVSLTDRPNMPYMESLLLEVLRCSSIVPGGVPHTTLSDMQINGYDIKKGTVILTNMHYIHYNKNIWGDPLNFRPERFLSPDGKTFKKHEAAIPFCVGRRQCIGESLARDTLFLFITNIFQRFSVAHADPSKLAKDVSEVALADFVTPSPAPYKVIIKDRM